MKTGLRGVMAAQLGLALMMVSQAASAGVGPVRFGIMSDVHLYSQKLGVTGPAFEDYLREDPKLLEWSEGILDAAIAGFVQEGVQFVLVPGDLTKDGEMKGHVEVAQALARLERSGVKVYVIPGNHDINNPDAVRFRENGTRKAAGASAEVFRALYNQYGYGEAISRDKGSLSYVAEPVEGIWVLGIDAGRYEENVPGGSPVVGGAIKPATLEWIEGVMFKAAAKGKRVIPFMHHGLNRNFPGQDLLFGDYLVAGFDELAVRFAGWGMSVIFTGHYHNTDVALPIDLKTQSVLAPIWDVETPSLGSYPAACRIATINAGYMQVETRRVTEVEGWSHPTMTFQEWAKAWTAEMTVYAVIDRMVAILQVSEQEAAVFAPMVVEALMAQYDGDEQMPAERMAQAIAMMGSGNAQLAQLGEYLLALWYDMPPGDNTATIPW